ncbi:hypothetical protein BOVA711_3919 [Bacteroides ovatus]|nr:hypothetical protein BOVA711_3919 [Bacteroides ovatus]
MLSGTYGFSGFTCSEQLHSKNKLMNTSDRIEQISCCGRSIRNLHLI